MKQLITLLLTLFTFSVKSQSPSKINVVDDIKYFIKSNEQLQVQPYRYIEQNLFKLKVDRLLKTLPDTPSVKQAFVLVNQVAALYNDGHIYVDDNDTVTKAYESAIVFPLHIIGNQQGKLLIKSNYSDAMNVPVGTVITSINGQSGKLIWQRLLTLQGGLMNYRVSEVNKYLNYNLWLLDIKAPYAIEYRLPGVGVLHRDTLYGISYPTFRKLTHKQRDANYSFKMLNNNVGLLDFKAMHGSIGTFKSFLDSCFVDLRARKAKGLIVDLRSNLGGNSELGELLISYITTRPYRLSAGRRLKVSDQYKNYMSEDKEDWSDDEYNRYQKMPIGSVLQIVYSAKNYMPQNPNRYSIKTCFLIGAGNFSSATMLADGAQTYGLGTLIGEPTGAPANGSGEVYTFTLPNTKLTVNVPVTFDIRANGSANDKGPVKPDILVGSSNGGVAQVDRQKAYAMKWLER